jgi:glycosyltransferase involved in cell wall biosynthesis
MKQRLETVPTTNNATRARFRKLSVLMPVFNEVRTLRTIVKRVLNAPVDIPLELVIVDDGSTDGSRDVIQELAAIEPRIQYVLHGHNQGKGAAIRTAIEKMTGDLALIQDADLEYNPEDYPNLLRPMLKGVADVVFGSRFLSGEYRRVLYFWHSVANHLLTFICNVLNNINLTDMETGYKLIRADVLRSIPLTANGFALEPELTTKLAQWGLRIYEVPISYQGRTYEEGKKIGAKDAVSAVWAMLKYRFLSRKFTTHEGFYILQSVRKARGFNRWMMQQFRPHIGRRVLEAGCGIGNLSHHLLDCERLICVDNDAFYVERIANRYGHLENVTTHELDLTVPEDYSAAREGEPDTILCVNVLEHLADDDKVLNALYETLQPGGKLILLVPMHPRLYTHVDRTLGHYRRYTRGELMAKFRGAGFEVVSAQGFNRLGALGWFVSGKLLRRRTLSPGQMKVYEWLLPIAKLCEYVPGLPHLSIIVTGRKPLEPRSRVVSETKRGVEEVQEVLSVR